MRPGFLLLCILGGWIFLALVLALARPWISVPEAQILSNAWWLGGLLLGVFLTIDAAGRKKCQDIEASRYMPGSFSLGTVNTVKLTIYNPHNRQLDLVIYDHFPQQLVVDIFPLKISVPPNEKAEIIYKAKPIERGDAEFHKIEMRVLSQFKLWQFRIFRGEDTTIRIYPNFANIGSLSALEYEHRTGQIGIHVHQRRGQGLDFHQLREYRKGDALATIDWKASARYSKLISREYQDERDQDIIFLLDCGRRMRTMDGEYSHFDHALNAVLLTAFVALKQGDAAGILSFAGETRWTPPIKGPTAINKLLNQVYDLHSTTQASDLLQAAEHLLARHRKRALVILISNIREEDGSDLQAATRALSKQHLVMVASLREELLDNISDTAVVDMKSALLFSGAQQFIGKRKQLLERLVSNGVVITDSLAKTLHVDLANKYLQLKRSGRI